MLGRSDGPEPVFGVWRMALALALAAFLGGALGLVWQSAGFGEDDEAEVAEEPVEPVDPPSN
ncbi:hypothetical protein M3P36_10230 [Altererythrobacter sp. KTW20L]|nr:hypothetical protein [Altererythrobacter sp. KTW20L]